MDYKTQSELLAGQMALLKYSLTRFGTSISDDAVQILGGRGLTVGGLGHFIEQFLRTYKFDSVRQILLRALPDSRSCSAVRRRC